MAKVSLRSGWPAHVGVAVGYALLYLAVHPITTLNWPIHAGIRFACLLLFPYRFWPALLVGEALPNLYEVLPCLDSLGRNWVMVRSIPALVPIMPIVWWCREKMPPFPAKRLVDIKALIVCIVLCSVGGMLYSTLAYAMCRPFLAADADSVPLASIQFLLGPYVVILSVVPWLVMAKLDYRPGHFREQLRQTLSSKLFMDTIALLLPSIAILACLRTVVKDPFDQIASLAMFLPMAWLTLKHGWRAAAVSGTIAILCICLPLDVSDKLQTRAYESMVFVVIGVTCLFVLGARISAQLLQEEKERRSAMNVQRLARQTMQMGEQRMRQTSQALEYLAGTLHVTNSRLLEQMRRIVPNIESHAFYKQAMAAQTQIYQLAESMHPLTWRERGLPAALNDTVARALDEAGIAYRCEITGRGFTRLASPVLTVTYRAACEAITYVTSRLACSRVRLVLRGGETQGRRWVVIRVEGVLEDTGVANAVYFAEERKRLGTKLGASGLDISEMRDNVGIFDGALHLRSFKDRLRITALLHDASQEQEAQRAASHSAAPLRLWVK
ncbi:MASE1 domain-containing protein [Dyella acidiphila]|uniref:MASE1 domain-containing protein n=1 Tax=Dyella acidiphila TaxID=2775866 RepID=A0ABR9G648_9GAMM|nr:MASE1 domain-containing protein [Dyella acidiphila]MBE1159526.1 MASE1 domain-containing protein [Dyella acidiphila]